MLAVALLFLAALSGLGGIALSAASSCCGSRDPADPTAARVGIFVAVGLSAAGVGLWSGRVSRRVVLLCSAAAPAAVLAASPSSSDFQVLAPVAAACWAGLWWFLRRPVARGWSP